jgi:hypothetical protein
MRLDMKLSRKTYAVSVACAVASTFLFSSTIFAKGETYTLDSMKISAPIGLEADNAAWAKATPLNLTLAETPY